MESSILIAKHICPAGELSQRTHLLDTHLDPTDSALHALTDFRREYPIIIAADRTMLQAFHDMARLRVHALLVTPSQPEGAESISGLLTVSDILRQAHGAHGRHGKEVSAGDVMTPVERLPLVIYDSLKTLTAFQMFERFQGTGLTHLLVIERHHEEVVARGLLSRSTLARRLQH